jgi:hypothetical protein
MIFLNCGAPQFPPPLWPVAAHVPQDCTGPVMSDSAYRKVPRQSRKRQASAQGMAEGLLRLTPTLLKRKMSSRYSSSFLMIHMEKVTVRPSPWKSSEIHVPQMRLLRWGRCAKESSTLPSIPTTASLLIVIPAGSTRTQKNCRVCWVHYVGANLVAHSIFFHVHQVAQYFEGAHHSLIGYCSISSGIASTGRALHREHVQPSGAITCTQSKVARAGAMLHMLLTYCNSSNKQQCTNDYHWMREGSQRVVGRSADGGKAGLLLNGLQGCDAVSVSSTISITLHRSSKSSKWSKHPDFA